MEAPVAVNAAFGQLAGFMHHPQTQDFGNHSDPVVDADESLGEKCKQWNYSQHKNTYRRPRTLSSTLREDRQLRESARFFEALGEDKRIASQTTLDIVDTAGEESLDEDGSAFEIHAETIPANRPVHCSSIVHEIVRTPPFTMLPSHASLPSLGPKTGHSDYIGIGENSLAITKHGVQRGNYSTLHRKAWLEVSDPKHRYGKNLRLYYRHWGTLNYPTNNFFDWLDSKGAAEGQELPNLADCPRRRLDSDTVLYITDSEVSQSYALSVATNREGRRGQILDIDGEPVSTGSEGWIFVLRDNILYGSRKITAVCRHSKQRFHHSSFFGGKAVAAAGIFVTDQDGFLTHLYPHSGHYRPGEADIQRCLSHLYSEGVNLQSFLVDMQQIIHVARTKDAADPEEKGKKKQKMSCLHLEQASYAARYLSHKAKCIKGGIFQQIAQIEYVRQRGTNNVAMVLNAIDSIPAS